MNTCRRDAHFLLKLYREQTPSCALLDQHNQVSFQMVLFHRGSSELAARSGRYRKRLSVGHALTLDVPDGKRMAESAQMAASYL